MVIHMRNPKSSTEPDPLADLIRDANLDLNSALQSLPKSSVSTRIPAMHAMALKVIAQETTLSISEILERLICLGINDALTNRRVPAFMESNAVRFDHQRPEADQDGGQA